MQENAIEMQVKVSMICDCKSMDCTAFLGEYDFCDAVMTRYQTLLQYVRDLEPEGFQFSSCTPSATCWTPFWRVLVRLRRWARKRWSKMAANALPSNESFY
ncbi:hypothetical protein QR680_001494 [Steinernema hermaphroditum]|uniref:Uncharacterized protein n=1 Tax=Steinernema hermaphroditum TaxID=289476 RepID=A0AA39GYK6_9BILA|nr:hypothetical protein QR680_001494 [Steinernema hermaphroditum]